MLIFTDANFHLPGTDVEEISAVACLAASGQNKLPEEQAQVLKFCLLILLRATFFYLTFQLV